MKTRFLSFFFPLVAFALLANSATAEVENTAAVPSKVAAVTPVNDQDYAPAMLALIENARHSIRICLYQVRYYEEYPDSESNRLIEALGNAAQRGLEVTVILDRTGWRAEQNVHNEVVGTMLAEAGAWVYFDSPDVQSHQKLAIFDRDIVVVSSANWSHYSLTHNNEASVILWAQDAGRHYNEYFAARLVEAERWVPEGTSPAPLANAFGPEDLGMKSYPATQLQYLDNQNYYPKLSEIIANAQESIHLVQNYAYYYSGNVPGGGDVPGRPADRPPEPDLLLYELIEAQQRGVQVSAIFDVQWTEDFKKPWNHRTVTYAEKLHEAGARAYRDDPEVQIHAKMLVIDGKKVLIGSANWSYHAMALNNECSVVIHSPELVEEVYDPWVEDIFDRGEHFQAPFDTTVGAETGGE